MPLPRTLASVLAVALFGLCAAPGLAQTGRPPAPKVYVASRPTIEKYVAGNNAKSAKALMSILSKASKTSKALARRANVIQGGDPRGIPDPKNQGEAEKMRRELIKHLEPLEAYWQWHLVLVDVQEAVSKMTAKEAAKEFLKKLTYLDDEAQIVVLMGLRRHPPSPEIEAAVMKLMAKTREPRVRVACIELAGFHGIKAIVEPALAILKDPKARMSEQIAACRTLAVTNDPAVIPALLHFLQTAPRVRCQYEANAALRTLTGQPFHPHNHAHWRVWWQENKDTFKGLTADQFKLQFNYELHLDPEVEKARDEAAGGDSLHYYNIPFATDRVVFVLDTSGSMQELAPTGKSRLDEARIQLKKLIEELPEYTQFGIVLFNTAAAKWPTRSAIAPATKANKASAIKFLSLAKPTGTTATMAALEAVIRYMSGKADIDTVFMLTDGAANPMFLADYYKNYGNVQPQNTATEIVKRIRFINQTRKIRINTIATGEAPTAFLKVIADLNDGILRSTGMTAEDVLPPPP